MTIRFTALVAVLVLTSFGPPPAEAQALDAGQAAVARSVEEWAGLIDATWGPGMGSGLQVDLFDQVLASIRDGFGAFHNLDVDLDALRARYRPELQGGVSRGRFAAIMNQISLALKDCHTFIIDLDVSWRTAAEPGVPLFVVGAWIDNTRFGASLTVLPDDTLLVYRALSNQRLGLGPGDIVLGYDGVPWNQLYRQLIEAELPIQLVWVCGSTDESMHHCMMMSAGLNWHLFDTIDVIKYDTGETLHLSTAPLQYQSGIIIGNEQLPVPGVPMPDGSADDFVSWGIVEGTDIGYIYVASWAWEPEYRISEQFYEAVHALMYEHDTSGLILDFRLNTGGGADVAEAGLSLLFDFNALTIGYDLRVEGSQDPLEMYPHPGLTPGFLMIHGDPASSYDRPIAVLIGPGTVSAGDVHSQRLLAHPRVRTFGKPSNGGFTLNDNPDLGSRWWYSRATGCAYTVDGHRYLAHTGVPVDVEVWLTPDDVAAGRDTVVEAAVKWIRRSVPRRPSGRRLPRP